MKTEIGKVYYKKDLLEIFNAGKSCMELHPDDDSYDKIHLNRVVKKINKNKCIKEGLTDETIRNFYYKNIAPLVNEKTDTDDVNDLIKSIKEFINGN